jgi:hypothetical protein
MKKRTALVRIRRAAVRQRAVLRRVSLREKLRCCRRVSRPRRLRKRKAQAPPTRSVSVRVACPKDIGDTRRACRRLGHVSAKRAARHTRSVRCLRIAIRVSESSCVSPVLITFHIRCLGTGSRTIKKPQ